MVQPAEDRWSVHQSRGGASRGRRIGEALLQPLVWPVYATYSPEEPEYVGFVEDEQVVQARSADAAQHARTNGMLVRGAVGGTHLVDAGSGGQGGDGRTARALVVANQVRGVLAAGGGPMQVPA